MDSSRCFECQQCAAERRGKVQSKLNGKIGDLSLTRFSKLKKSAESRDIKFELTIDYLWNLFESQKHICAITGDYINSIEEASLDRINSNGYYSKDNVQ